MKRVTTAAALLAVFGLAAACTAPAAPEPDTDAMLAAAEDLDARFLAAFNAGDTATLGTLYWNSPDSVSFPPDSMIKRGFSEVRAGFDDMIETMAGAVLELVESHHSVAGDVVLTWGLWRMTMTGPDGEPMELSGRFTDVKAERDGRWVYIMDHASVPLPPPPDGMD